MSKITLGPAQIDTSSIDIDISGLTLEVVSVMGRDMVMRGTGGAGWWTDNESGEPVEVDDVRDLDITISLEEAPENVWTHIRDQLIAWAEEGTPLRFIGVRVMLLWDGKTLIPLPRRTFQGEVVDD